MALVIWLVWAAAADAVLPYQAYESAVTADGPVSQFRFDDLPGSTTLADSAGGFTALNTGIALGGEGPFGGSKSGSFAVGTEAFATLGGNPLAGAHEFAVEAWVNWGGGSSTKEPVFDIGSSATNYMYLTPSSALAKHPMLFEIHPFSGAALQVIAPAKLGAKSWEYVVVTETSSGTVSLYLNGELIQEVKGTTVSPASLGSAPLDSLGMPQATSEPQFKGSLSNVALYTKPLSSAQITGHLHSSQLPFNSSSPTITGVAKDGGLLKAKEGSWAGLAPLAFVLHWQHELHGTWTNVPGPGGVGFATGVEYRPTGADVGLPIRVMVTGENTLGANETPSAATAAVAPVAPKNEELPTVTGKPENGQVQTATPGKWGGSPATYSYQWESCIVKKCTPITGATEPTYRATSSVLGDTLRVAMTASNGAGTSTATSPQTPVAITNGPPVSLTAPVISGEAREGRELSTSQGTWAGAPVVQYSYAWVRCQGASCAPIPGASGASYKATAADVGDTLRVEVTALSLYGPTTVASTPSTPVVGVPAYTALPTVEGEATEGATLTAKEGTWTGTPTISYSFAWERCAGAICTPTGAGGTSYKATASDVGDTLRVLVTATNSLGSTSATSAATGVVTGGPPKVSAPPVITGEALEGNTLNTTEGTWSGTPTPSFNFQWQRCREEECANVPGATSSSYAVTHDDNKDTLRVVVTATNSAGEASANSAPTAEAQSNANAVGWGENYHGQLGQIYRDNYELSPVPVEGVPHISELAAGGSFALALLSTGEVISWGGDAYGQLGDDASMSTWEHGVGHVTVKDFLAGAETPAEFPALTGVKQVAASGPHALALMKDGTVKAWGNNLYGGLGNGNPGFISQTNINARVARTVTWPAINKTEEVIIKKVAKTRHVTEQAGTLTNIRQIAIGGGGDFALTHDHTVMAWGDNNEGQLGLGLGEPGPEGCETEVAHFPTPESCSTVPRPVTWVNPQTGHTEPISGVKQIVGGEYASYALLKNGHVLSWGDNREGQLGTGNITEHGTELPVEEVRVNDGLEGKTGEPLSGVVELTGGYSGAMARIEKNGKQEVVGWGSDVQGALTLNVSEAPVVDCRTEHTSEQEDKAKKHKEELITAETKAIEDLEKEIVKDEEKGENVDALKKELADDKKKLKEMPEPIACLKKATPLPALTALQPQQLAAGNNYGVALAAGKVYTWGKNERGQIGNGLAPKNTTSPVTGNNIPESGYPSPTQVPGFGPAIAITAALSHPFALLKADSPRPAAAVAVTPEHLAMKLEWSPTTTAGVPVAGEKLAYSKSTRNGENTSAEEGGDPENESGPPVNSDEAPPVITGVEEGASPAVETKKPDVIKVDHGSWSGARPISFEYQWERCNSEEKECIKIDKEGKPCASGCPSEYPGETVVKEDVGLRLRATVIATGPEPADEQGTATTEATTAVVLEEGESERTTQINRKSLTDPFTIIETIERFPLTKEQKEQHEKHREVRQPLEATAYELTLKTGEFQGAGQKSRPIFRTMVAKPLE